MAEVSKTSRLKAKANEEAINEAVGVLETSIHASSNSTPTDKVINSPKAVVAINETIKEAGGGIVKSTTTRANTVSSETIINAHATVDTFNAQGNASMEFVGVYEVPEDWEASPIAQPFSSLLDSNELRKRNREAVSSQSMDNSPHGHKRNLLYVLNNPEEQENPQVYGKNQAKPEFDPNSHNSVQSKVFVGSEYTDQSQTSLNGTIGHLMPTSTQVGSRVLQPDPINASVREAEGNADTCLVADKVKSKAQAWRPSGTLRG